MESNWHETSLRNQVAKLDIHYSDVDLAQTEPPSVFGLRRRVIAAALDHVAHRSLDDASAQVPSSPRQFQDKGLSDWLTAQQPNSTWKPKLLRKKISFGKKQTKPAFAVASSIYDTCQASSFSDSASRRRASSTSGSISSHDKMLKRDEELTEREVDFDLVVLSRFETAELKMTVYTEHRQGNWVLKGPAPAGSTMLDEPPLIYSAWDCAIDSRAIVERKKLRSYVELSDTTCAVRCTSCSSEHAQHLGNPPETYRVHSGATMACKHCQGSGAVQATYVVCVTLRQSNFLPLTMPVRHQAGKRQNAFRAYLPRTTKAMSHIDVLRMRSIEAVRSCALRVGRAHHREHDARLLMAKAVLERRSCNSVAVINRVNGLFRTFDVTDGGSVRGGAGLIEEESRIIETHELTEALSRLAITRMIHPEATYKFFDLELVDMATSKNLSLTVEQSRSPSMRTMGSSGDESYSPSAFPFFHRAQSSNLYGSSGSRDSETLRGVHLSHPVPPTRVPDSERPHRGHSSTKSVSQTLSSATSSSASSLRSFNSAQQRASTTPDASSFGMLSKPCSMVKSVSTGSACTMLSGSSSISAQTAQSWQTAPARQPQ